MAIIVPLRRRMTALVLIGASVLIAQPLPPKPGSQAVEHRIAEIRSRLEKSSPANPQQSELATFAQRYLDDAVRALHAGRRFQAQRLADAADACRRPIDHLQHAAESPAEPPRPLPEPEDHLRQVYFRLRLCDFFLQQIPPPAPVRLREIARGFYEQAVKAQQANRAAIAEEYAKAADDLTHALESLAQAALP